MSNRKEPLVEGEYYHIYNRGVDKRDVFTCTEDVERFLESLLVFNRVESTGSIRDQREHCGVKRIDSPDVERLGKGEPLVDVVAYCILPNHFHFILKQRTDNGISEFMKRLLGGYTKYFNEGNDRTGALFQGAFKSKLCSSDDYFKTLSAYVSYNFTVHDIPKAKLLFVKTSLDEYRSKHYLYVSKSEAEFALGIFGTMHKLEAFAKETVAFIRQKRGREALEDKKFLLE